MNVVLIYSPSLRTSALRHRAAQWTPHAMTCFVVRIAETFAHNLSRCNNKPVIWTDVLIIIMIICKITYWLLWIRQTLHEFVIKLTIIALILKFIYIPNNETVFTNMEITMINFVTRKTNKNQACRSGFYTPREGSGINDAVVWTVLYTVGLHRRTNWYNGLNN
jgi:hypothetical protein